MSTLPDKEKKINSKQYELLKDWSEKHPEEEQVLTPLILQNWDTILKNSATAWEFAMESLSMPRSRTYKPMPGILENILPIADKEKTHSSRVPFWEDGLKFWDEAEQYLHDRGLRTGDLEYYDCGREAIVFKIRNAPDVLLKISKYKKIKSTDLVMEALARHRTEYAHPDSLTSKISVAIVPYLGDGEEKEKDPSLHDVALPDDVIEKWKDVELNTPQKMKRLLEIQGIDFDDSIATNMRGHSALPNLRFVIDRRAVENSRHPKDFSEEEKAGANKIIEAYDAVQGAIHAALLKKYLPKELPKDIPSDLSDDEKREWAVFSTIAEIAHPGQGTPAGNKPGVDSPASTRESQRRQGRQRDR